MKGVNHKYLKKNSIEGRLYQETILGSAIKNNTLVVLPTGLGKTYVAALLAARRLEEFYGSKILFLAPTKPLVEQHCSTWRNLFNFNEDEFEVFTGMYAPAKRRFGYEDVNFIFATPQVIQNDIVTKKISLKDFSLLIIDEAHRASGAYPYGFIAKKYMEESNHPRILALTASPGSSRARIDGICNELFIEKVEARTREDRDVLPYVEKSTQEWIKVPLPREFKKVKSLLEGVLKEYLDFLKKGGVLQSAVIGNIRKKQILDLQASLASRASSNKDLYPYVSGAAAVLKIDHSIELLETQGVVPLCEYFEKLKSDRSQAARNLLMDKDFRAAVDFASSLNKQGINHPKLEKLLDMLTGEESVIVFAHYRSSVNVILKKLKEKKIPSAKLIGQFGKGMSQKEQVKVLDNFRKGKYKILVATSIGEEGLDIPSVDRVVFYEPVPSAIRTIQRMGRTARVKPGKISILIAEGTRDEGYYWSAYHKERRMNTLLKGMNFKVKAQRTLDKFVPKKEETIIMFVDNRESGSGIVKELSELGVEVRMEQLEIADFQLSTRVGVERKTTGDFIQSIVDGRLMRQANLLRGAFEKPLFIIEGASLYGIRKVHPNAIRGALAALAVDFNIPILFSEDFKETAALLAVIAKREQLDLKKEVILRGGKRPLGLQERQRYIIESLPGVGPNLAKKLLEKFKSVEKVITAEEGELKKIGKIGDKKAGEIKKVLHSKYKKS